MCFEVKNGAILSCFTLVKDNCLRNSLGFLALFIQSFSDTFLSVTWNSQAEEGEEDEEIKDLFKIGKKKKKNEKSPAEIAYLVETVMAELEVTAEEDAELNRQGKPAINKLKKLNLLTEVLSKYAYNFLPR